MRTRNVLGAALVLLAFSCPMAWAGVEMAPPIPPPEPGDAQLMVYLIDDGDYVAGDIVLNATGTLEAFDMGFGPGVYFDGSQTPPIWWDGSPDVTWITGYTLQSPTYKMSFTNSTDTTPWAGGVFAKNYPFQIEFLSIAENFLYVPPGSHTWPLGAKYKMAEMEDQVFEYGEFGGGAVRSPEVIWVVPEPGTVALLITGLASLFLFWRRRVA